MTSKTKGKKTTARSSGSSKGASDGNRKKTVAGNSAGARGKASSSGRKTASQSRSRSSSASYPKGRPVQREMQFEKTNPMLIYEICLWVVLALAVFLFISLLGVGGSLGKTVSGFIFGCFGIMGYPFPFLLVLMTAFLIANRRSHIAKIKAAAAVGLYLTFCGLMELLLLGYSEYYQLYEYYDAGAKYKTGGGLTGGIFVNLFCPAIGVVGAYIMLFIMLIIFLILITQKSVFAGVRKQSSKVLSTARNGQAQRREQRRLRKEAMLEKELYLTDSYAEDEEDDDEFALNFSILPKERPVTVRSTRPQTKASEEAVRFRKVTGVTTDLELPKKKASREENSMFSQVNLDEPETEYDEEITINGTGFRDRAAQDRMNDLTPERRSDQAGTIKAEEKVSAAERSVDRETEQNSSGSGTRRTKASKEEIQEGIDGVDQEIEQNALPEHKVYQVPPTSLLVRPEKRTGGPGDAQLRETAVKLQQVLQTFGVNVKVTSVTCGPRVIRYELMPELGVKVSRITNLADDLKLNLAVTDIRIEAPIPGKAAVGIEIPNQDSTEVLLRELLESEAFRKHPSDLAYVVGKDLVGDVIVSDIAKMPHLLIAGATGSGKSVFINTLIMSIIYKSGPDQVKLIMIDPKVVELSVYNGIPHLLIPVVTDPKKAAGALNWAVQQMMQRYQLFADMGVRDLKGYNAKVEKLADIEMEDKPEKLPLIVIIVDELADLMMVASGEVEDAIVRLTQLARAAGIHLVIATQRPSVDVITGLIKANMPSRIAFSVSSGVDSRTILDVNGAEKLLGHGDMLFLPQTYKNAARIQGAFVSDNEVADVVNYLKDRNSADAYDRQIEEQIAQVQKSGALSANNDSDSDELFADAGRFIIEKDKASIGMLQRWFKIGFNRAARIMDQLADAQVVGPEEGTKPRKVLMSMEQFENYLEEN